MQDFAISVVAHEVLGRKECETCQNDQEEVRNKTSLYSFSLNANLGVKIGVY